MAERKRYQFQDNAGNPYTDEQVYFDDKDPGKFYTSDDKSTEVYPVSSPDDPRTIAAHISEARKPKDEESEKKTR